MGVLLSHLDLKGIDHPIRYFSRKLLLREQKYSTVGKECLAIKLGIQAFLVYSLGQAIHAAELSLGPTMAESNAKFKRMFNKMEPNTSTLLLHCTSL